MPLNSDPDGLGEENRSTSNRKDHRDKPRGLSARQAIASLWGHEQGPSHILRGSPTDNDT